ncbi:MAG: ABC transporter permease subunit [Albidovulum sp.]|nr:ABC transporter permease subunit [Albidovulum sp.]MDE0308087.1 ABC transporter permease subunit [Albidovulum sp.]MDE0532626.1 ABC transporter permease subunit [Albidovulum sp.]
MAIHILAYAAAELQIGPVLLVVPFSFAPARSIISDVIPSSVSLKNYIGVLSGGEAFFPLKNSLLTGSYAVSVAIAVSLFVVVLDHKFRSKQTLGLGLSFMLPWILPAPFIAIGLIIAFATLSVFISGFTPLESFWIHPVGYATVSIPLPIRFLRAAFGSLDPSQAEAARSLGATPLFRFVRVTLPAVLPVIVLIGGLQLNGLLSEYAISAFLFNVNNELLSIALFDGARSSDLKAAAINLIYMTILMSFSFVVISLVDRFGLGAGNIRPKRNAAHAKLPIVVGNCRKMA